MRHVISMGAQRYTFMKRPDLQPGETPLALTQTGARQIIDPMMRNPMSNRILRTLLKEVSAFAILAKLGDTEVSAQLVKRIASGEITVVQSGTATSAFNGKKPTEVQKPEELPAPKVFEVTALDDIHWIRFEIKDTDEKRVPGIQLELAFSGKKPETFHAGRPGVVDIQKLKPGKCDLQRIVSADVYEVIE